MKKFFLILLLVCVSSAFAVKTESWTHSGVDDFKDGEFDAMVLSSRGRLALARSIEPLLTENPKVDFVHCLTITDKGILFAGTGPNGLIFKITRKGKPVLFAETGEKHILTLIAEPGARDLVAGTGGGKAKLLKIDPKGKVETIAELPGASAVWALTRAKGKNKKDLLLTATGPEGKLFSIDPEGTVATLLDLKQKNITCLALGPDGRVYLGADGSAGVYRVDPASGKPFVIYAPSEDEVSALTFDRKGNLFAGTTAGGPRRRMFQPSLRIPIKMIKPPMRPPGLSSPKPRSAPPDARTKAEIAKKLTAALTRSQQGKRPSGTGAVYRINREGFVRKVFKAKAPVLSLLSDGDDVLVGLGNGEGIYRLRFRPDSQARLVKPEAANVAALTKGPGGEIFVAGTDPGAIYQLSGGYAKKGTFTSEPLDAAAAARWGKCAALADLPKGTQITIQTRSGNTDDPEKKGFWNPFARPQSLTGKECELPISSPTARFLQYRLTFRTTRLAATPSLRELTIFRIGENQPPRIDSIKVDGGKPKKPSKKIPAALRRAMAAKMRSKRSAKSVHKVSRKVSFSANDPNGDTLLYDVAFRLLGDNEWIELESRTRKNSITWDTQSLPDGRYELKVSVSDAPDNPAGTALTDERISEVQTVDNTAPKIILKALQVGPGRVELRAGIFDAASRITSALVAVDSQTRWRPIPATDGVLDSPREQVRIVITDLAPGPHRFALQAADLSHNIAATAIFFEVK